MEIYMTRNATTRTGLVPLWGRVFISWYIDVLLDLDKVFWHLDSYDREHSNTPIVANDNLLFFVSLSDTSSSMPLNSFNESSDQHNDYAAININQNNDDIQNLILSSLNMNKNNNNNNNNVKINS